jgi:Isy1-like splicing family
MARNEEKAMAMLNRWVRAKRELGQPKPMSDKDKQLSRPHDP